MKKAIHFGAGSIGRGFIGSLLSRSGYKVIFVDVDRSLIAELSRRGSYTLEVVGTDQQKTEKITSVTGLHPDDPQLMKDFLTAEIITTAVGPGILPSIAPIIAKGITCRLSSPHPAPLHIIACENMLQASRHLKKEVLKHLPTDSYHYYSPMIGFPDAAVDRIVPPLEERKDMLSIRTEEFYEWIVDEKAFVCPPPKIEGMQLTKNLPAFVERKLFTLNTAHSITAYLGHLRGYHTILESITDKQILPVVRGAMKESAEILIQNHGFEREAHASYIEKILRRFHNPWLKDEVSRVGREPLRKLGPEDRLVKPLRESLRIGTSHNHLVTGVAAALHFYTDKDPQAQELKKMITMTRDLHKVITAITSLRGKVVQEIVDSYERLR